MRRNLRGIRVALVSTGLGHVHRAYESFIQDLYETLRGYAPVTLFKGAGYAAPPDIMPVPCLPRHHPLAKRLMGDDEARRYRAEQISLAISGTMWGHWKQYDIIHFCDPDFGNTLARLRQVFQYPYKLLFANGANLPVEACRRFDHVQTLTPAQLEAARIGMRKSRLSMVPVGVWTERFQVDADRQALRREFGLPAEHTLILSVGSLDEPHKRFPFLIETVAALDDPQTSLVVIGAHQGSAQSQETLDRAKALLGERFHCLTLPYARMPEVYAAGDLMILPALAEGFGKPYLEAMAAGLPLLCHDSESTRWLVPNDWCRLDMENPAALIDAIRRMRTDTGRAVAESNRQWVARTFHWSVLHNQYIELYERLILLPS